MASEIGASEYVHSALRFAPNSGRGVPNAFARRNVFTLGSISFDDSAAAGDPISMMKPVLLLIALLTMRLSSPAAETAALYQSDFRNARYGCIPDGWEDLIAMRPTRNWAVDGNGFVRAT